MKPKSIYPRLWAKAIRVYKIGRRWRTENGRNGKGEQGWRPWLLDKRLRGQIFILYFLRLLLRRREENLVKNKDSTPGLSCYSLDIALESKR